MSEWRKDESFFGSETYAQHGDDLMLVNIFRLLGIEKPSFIDLGAHSPMTISNTYLLYLRGSRGVNVEANPELMAAFYKHRPEDKNVWSGVGARPGILPFYMWDENTGSGVNTFSHDEVEFLMQENPHRKIKEIKQIQVRTVREILDEHCGGKFPQLLLTDIEGFDHEVLESCDFISSRPMVICAEIRPWKSQVTKDLLDARGYFVYCRMQANLIFVDKTYLHLLY